MGTYPTEGNCGQSNTTQQRCRGCTARRGHLSPHESSLVSPSSPHCGAARVVVVSAGTVVLATGNVVVVKPRTSVSIVDGSSLRGLRSSCGELTSRAAAGVLHTDVGVVGTATFACAALAAARRAARDAASARNAAVSTDPAAAGIVVAVAGEGWATFGIATVMAATAVSPHKVIIVGRNMSNSSHKAYVVPTRVCSADLSGR